MHGSKPYDPVKAHEYYLRTRKLKGKKSGGAQAPALKSKDAPRGSLESIPAQMQKYMQDRAFKKDAKSTDEKIKEITAKLQKLAQLGKGPSDVSKRTTVEKKQKVTALRKDLSDLNQALKNKIATKAPQGERAALQQQIAAKQKQLDDAVNG